MSTHRCPADDDAAIRNVLSLAALLNDEGDPEDQRKVHAPDATWHLAPGTWHLGDITRKGADEMVAAAWGAATMASSAPEPMPAIS
jgi:SnoaL-like domain